MKPKAASGGVVVEGTDPPPIAPLRREALPERLTGSPCWTAWQYRSARERLTKQPCKPNGRPHDITKRENLLTFEEVAALQGRRGAGFVFTGDGVVGVDFDHCRDPETGEIEPWAQERVRRLNSYTEVSPSGTGLHVYVDETKLPEGKGRKRGPLEVYDRGRFFTVTGNHLPGTPLTIESRQAEIDKLLAEDFAGATDGAAADERPTLADAEVVAGARVGKNRHRFVLIHDHGDVSTHPSPSEAYYELIRLLMEAGARGVTQIKRIIDASPLGRNEKWQKRAEYHIRRALAEPQKSKDDGFKLESDTASNIEMKPVEWLVDGLIPCGEPTGIQGAPDVGKSLFTADLAARVTTGAAYPDGRLVKRGRVAIMTTEGRAAQTHVPRLQEAGADLSMIEIIRPAKRDGDNYRYFVLPDHIDKLEQFIIEQRIVAIVFDPLVALFSDKANSHNDAAIRRVLYPLADMADRTGVAVIYIQHTNKMSSEQQAIFRGGGSIALTAFARAVYLIGWHPQDVAERKQYEQRRRVFAGVRYALGPFPPSKVFTTESSGGDHVAHVVWSDEPCALWANDLLTPPATKRITPALDAAKDWLRTVLYGGPVDSDDIKKRAEERGITEKTLRDAREALKVEIARDSSKVGQGSKTNWALPRHNGNGKPTTEEGGAVSAETDPEHQM